MRTKGRWSRYIAVLLTMAFVLISGVSCAQSDVPAGAVLSAMLSCEREVPTGTVYARDAEEGETGYLSDALCAVLYGDGAVPPEWSGVSDYAIYLSAAEHPFELAVFRCDSSDCTEEVAELCVRRLAVLRQYWRGSDLEAYASGGRVRVLGHYVVMILSMDPETLLEEARTAIG